MFGGYCFDHVMDDETNYRDCKYQCIKDCQETEYIVIDNVLPINYKKICREGRSMDKQVRHNFQQSVADTAGQHRPTPDYPPRAG